MNVTFGGLNGEMVLKSSADLTASGSSVVVLPIACTLANLIVNIDSIAGGGSLAFTMQEVDPVDQATAIGQSAETGALSNTGPASATITGLISTTLLISWVKAGTVSASSVNVTVTGK